MFGTNKEKHYEIENNVVYEVKKVRSDTGIVAEGVDRNENKIFINNLDAGNAKALMRVALEGKKRKVNIGPMTILLGTLITIVFFVLIFWGYNRFLKPTEVIAPDVFNEQQITTAPIPIKIDEEEQEQDKIDQNYNAVYELERESIKNEFANETLRLEISKRDLELNELSRENEKLENEKNILTDEVKQLNAIVYELQAQRTSRDGVLLQIGEYVDELCRINNTETCKDMYFNILKK